MQGSTDLAKESGAAGVILTADRAGSPPHLLSGLTPAQIDRVTAAGRRRVVHKGERLFSQGQLHDGIYLIESGRVRVFYVAPTGREITLAYWHPGNFVGGPEIYRRGRHTWSGVAMTSGRVLHLPGDALREMVIEIPTLASGLLEALIFKAKCYSALAQMLGTRSAVERLATLLLHLVDLYGETADDGLVRIGAALSHADLASMTGVTRQSVTTTLKRLSEGGLIDTRGPRIAIRDPDGLREVRLGRIGRPAPAGSTAARGERFVGGD